MTRQHAYDQLNKNSVFWGRSSDTTIYVHTSGYNTQNAHIIEVFLMKAGFRLVSQEYDKYSGQTTTTYKHPKVQE